MSDLPHGWELAKLRDAALPGREGFIDGDWVEAPYITNAGIRLIQTGNLGRGDFLDKPDSRKYISAASYRILNCTSVNAGDVLICRLADPIGRACEVPDSVGDAITAVDCTITRVDQSRYDKRFVLHWLNSDYNLKAAADMAAGSTRSRISRSNLGALPLPHPPRSEQSAIGRILDTLDTTIRQTEAIIEKLKLVKQGLLHDLLTRGIDANGDLRPPQSQAPHLYKDSPLGWIPREWEAIRMAEAIRELGQGWSPDCPPEPAAADRWGVLKTTAIVWDGYAENENKALPATLRPRPDLEVAPEDILITRAGPKERVAVVAYVAQTRSGLMISDKMYRLRLREADVPAYFALALSSQYAQAAVTSTISGMADSQTNISQPIIRMLQIMRPPKDEQRAISLRATALADRVRAEQVQLTALGSLKIGLMGDLLTGRVRVTPLLHADPPSA